MRAIIAIAVIAAAAGAAARPHAAKPAAAPTADVKKLIQNCDAHKFEATVQTTVDGEPHQSKVRLCGEDGQSDAEWIGTLKDAIAKLNTNADMPAAMREQIVTAINAEIARLQAAQTAGIELPATKVLLLPAQPGTESSAPLSNDYAALPPLPSTPPPPPHLLGAGGLAVAGALDGKAPPLPLAPGPAPKLSFGCFSPGDVGDDAPCAEFERETVLTIRAGETITRGLVLRFARNGEERATLDLPQLTRGKALRLALPSEVCAGVSDGKLDLELVKDGALLKSDGPYPLRC